MIRRVSLLVSFIFLILLFLIPSVGIAAPSSQSGMIPIYYIRNPCVNPVGNNHAVPIGTGPTQFTCLGVTELLSGRTATITLPTPTITARAPKLSIVALPTFLSIDWDPASFSYSDLMVPDFEYTESGVENKLINIHYELRVSPVDVSSESNNENYLSLANINILNPASSLSIGLIEDRAEVDRLVPAPFCDYRNDQIIANIAFPKGGFQSGKSGCLNLISLLPETPLANTNIDGYDFSEVPNELEGQVIAYWSDYASTQGTSRKGQHPAYELYVYSHWKIEARVSWDMHLRKADATEGEEVIICSWDFWGDPDSYIDWTEYPPFCKRIVEATEEWEIYCKLGSSDKPCDYGTFGNRPELWWQEIAPHYLISNVLTPEGEYSDRYSFVVLQAQPLLEAP